MSYDWVIDSFLFFFSKISVAQSEPCEGEREHHGASVISVCVENQKQSWCEPETHCC